MSFENKNNKNNAGSNDRKRGFDICQIIQTGHIVSVSGKDLDNGGANVTVGVRSSVGYRYDKDFDDNNEVTIFWTRYYKDGKAAEAFAEQCKPGKYVTVIGNRQDYNKKNKDGNWDHLYENYQIDSIQWGVDFSTQE
jgi:hypothetical protein